MATSQLFVLSVKLKMLMFGKDAINSINIQGTYEPYHFQPFPKKLHFYLKAHMHTTVQSVFFFFLPDFPLVDIFKKVLVYFSQPCSLSCLVFNHGIYPAAWLCDCYFSTLVFPGFLENFHP